MAVLDDDFDLLARVTSRVGPAETKPATPAQAAPAATPEPEARSWHLPGILGPTRVSTSFGDVPAHLVRVRDQLRTRDGGFQPVLRIDAYKLDDEFLQHRPDARPVLIRQGSLGGGLPAKDVMISPGQKLQVRSEGHAEKLLHARDVSSQTHLQNHAAGTLSYFVFHVAQPALARCEGLWMTVDAG